MHNAAQQDIQIIDLTSAVKKTEKRTRSREKNAKKWKRSSQGGGGGGPWSRGSSDRCGCRPERVKRSKRSGERQPSSGEQKQIEARPRGLGCVKGKDPGRAGFLCAGAASLLPKPPRSFGHRHCSLAITASDGMGPKKK